MFMKAYRTATKYKGVFERISSERLFKNKPDVCFDISYKVEGKRIFEKIGWISEGYSAKLASDIRSERLRSIRHGDELPKQKEKAPFFKEVAKKYLEWAEENKSRRGIDDKRRYRKHLATRLDEKKLNEISSFDLERIKNDLLKKELSPASVKHCLVIVRQMFNKAKIWGLYQGENPTKGVKLPTLKNQRERFLRYKEAQLLLDDLKIDQHRKKNPGDKKDPQLHDISLLSLHCGLRAGEIFNIRGHDVNFETEIINIANPKNNESRKAYMTKSIKTMLQKRKPLNPNDYIFKSKNGEKIETISQSFSRSVNRLKFNEGVKDRLQMVTFHTLRHTFASWLAMQGESLVTIRELMGHKSFEMTKRYAHLIPDHKKAAALNLERKFKAVRNDNANKLLIEASKTT